jgi:RsiW-degrading membrane proteinase PrsW (M82 family)/phage FluMu protein Com
MSISWHCGCGKTLKAPDGSGGKRARCPACKEINTIPTPVVEEPVEVAAPVASDDPWAAGDSPFDPYDLAEAPEPTPVRVPRQVVAAAASAAQDRGGVTPAPYRPAAARARDDDDDEGELPLGANPGGGRSWRDFTYLVLLLAMVPLVVSSFGGDRGNILEQIQQSVTHHPEVKERIEAMPESAELGDLINVFPGHRLDGAFLPRDSMVHWVFAAGSVVLFLTIMMFLFSPGCAKPKSLLLTGVFTGTCGILLLLGFQLVAGWTSGLWIRGRGIIVLLFYIVKFIGYSYGAADDPSNGFAASFFGYTFGVGLCEEVCKALPLIVMLQNLPERATWRTACLWGLASGVGFGVAEGIMYSGRYYNGIGEGDIYLVRFVSCVALHGTWAAAVAILLFKARGHIAGAEGIGGMLFTTAVIAMPSIVLHGLYDTLLKKDYKLYALAVALVSFLYLACLIEWSQWKREEAGSGSAGGRLARA